MYEIYKKDNGKKGSVNYLYKDKGIFKHNHVIKIGFLSQILGWATTDAVF